DLTAPLELGLKQLHLSSAFYWSRGKSLPRRGRRIKATDNKDLSETALVRPWRGPIVEPVAATPYRNHSFFAVHTTCVQTGALLGPSDQRRSRSNPLASILQDSKMHTFHERTQVRRFPLC